MAFVKKAYYRGFQAVFNVGARCLYWRRPIPVSGVGSVQKIPELLGKEKVQKVMVVTGPAVGKKLAPKILAELTGVKFTGSDAEKASAFIDEIRAMNKRMNIPTGFDFIKEEDIPQMITWALAEANPVYPVPVVYDRKRCEKVIRRIIAEA